MNAVLEVFYREPFTREVWTVPLALWENLEVHPTVGRVIDHFRITVVPDEVTS